VARDFSPLQNVTTESGFHPASYSTRSGGFSARSSDRNVKLYPQTIYRGADKSLARPTSRCILFDGENISPSLVIYINITNIPPIMIINRIYENQNLLSL
jgi:hypothetical protein